MFIYLKEVMFNASENPFILRKSGFGGQLKILIAIPYQVKPHFLVFYKTMRIVQIRVL